MKTSVAGSTSKSTGSSSNKRFNPSSGGVPIASPSSPKKKPFNPSLGQSPQKAKSVAGYSGVELTVLLGPTVRKYQSTTSVQSLVYQCPIFGVRAC